MQDNPTNIVELWDIVPWAIQFLAYVGGGLYACLQFQKLYVEVQIKRRELQQIINKEVESAKDNDSQGKPLDVTTKETARWAAIPGVLFFAFFADLIWKSQTDSPIQAMIVSAVFVLVYLGLFLGVSICCLWLESSRAQMENWRAQARLVNALLKFEADMSQAKEKQRQLHSKLTQLENPNYPGDMQ